MVVRMVSVRLAMVKIANVFDEGDSLFGLMVDGLISIVGLLVDRVFANSLNIINLATLTTRMTSCNLGPNSSHAWSAEAPSFVC